jgi:hypothetical protein
MSYVANQNNKRNQPVAAKSCCAQFFKWAICALIEPLRLVASNSRQVGIARANIVCPVVAVNSQ